jgi:hypothetical protein
MRKAEDNGFPAMRSIAEKQSKSGSRRAEDPSWTPVELQWTRNQKCEPENQGASFIQGLGLTVAPDPPERT